MATSVEEEAFQPLIDGFESLMKDDDESILMDFLLANKLQLEAIDSVAQLVEDYSNNAMRLVFCREVQRIHPHRAHEFIQRFHLESKFSPQQLKLEQRLSQLPKERVFGHFTRYPRDSIVVCAHLLQRNEHLLVERMQVEQHVLDQVLEEFHLKLDLEFARKQREYLVLTCLQLPAHVQITVISSLDQLRVAQFDFHLPVGIDVEWFPCGQPQAEMMQLAQQNQIFIFDLGKRSSLLRDRAARTELNTCLYEFLSKVPEMVMFGDGASDFKTIRNRHAQLNFASALCPNSNNNNNSTRIKLLSNPGGGGLSDFVARKLGGKILDKDMQQSNWRNRPWSKDQLHYAALDAWVLLNFA